jgi:hypothetical protein
MNASQSRNGPALSCADDAPTGYHPAEGAVQMASAR